MFNKFNKLSVSLFPKKVLTHLLDNQTQLNNTCSITLTNVVISPDDTRVTFVITYLRRKRTEEAIQKLCQNLDSSLHHKIKDLFKMLLEEQDKNFDSITVHSKKD